VNTAAAEALADPRIGPVSPEELEAELASWDDVETGAEPNEAELDHVRRDHEIEWAAATVTQGEILDAFGDYCVGELEDVELIERAPSRLALGWRRERSTIELRAGLAFCDRLATDGPVLLITAIGPKTVERFLGDPGLRGRVALLDLARLEKIAAVRSSVFVYFEWFLRDVYGVKILAEPMFTRGLVDQGIISLGMG
jgi:hypothetical protein